MLIIVNDTETTGLPIYKEPSEGDNQPHIVELAAAIYDDATGAKIESFCTLIRPDGWTIPDEVTAIHGITTERALDEGMPEHEALERYLAFHRQAELRVGHNISFDDRILRIAMKRFGDGRPTWPVLTREEKDAIADEYKAFPTFCTMKQDAKARCVKWPKLVEAYEYHLGKPMEGAHSAMGDVEGCAAVYFAMKASA